MELDILNCFIIHRFNRLPWRAFNAMIKTFPDPIHLDSLAQICFNIRNVDLLNPLITKSTYTYIYACF